MKKSLKEINTNVECGSKFKTTLRIIGFQYIKHLPKTQYFRRG